MQEDRTQNDVPEILQPCFETLSSNARSHAECLSQDSLKSLHQVKKYGGAVREIV